MLKALRLKISPCGGARTSQDKIQEAKVELHKRSCRRALDKVVSLRNDAVHPANIQRYLSRWVTWWKAVEGVDKLKLLLMWVRYTSVSEQKGQEWLG